jgi:hypothetical protein
MEFQCARKQFIRAAALAALGLVPVCASADNGEYRRPYEQGYQDGIEAQRHREHHHGWRQHIRIEEARYGLRGASCDARGALQQAVGQHRHVSVAINNNLCGDPVPGVQKRIRITYSCDNGEVFEVRAPERGVATLYCR